jgi:hypothetical protein
VTNDNTKIRAPKLAITKPMVDAGKTILAAMLDDTDNHSDDAFVAGVFFAMWEVYWTEVEMVRRKKMAGSPIVLPFKPKLILPAGTVPPTPEAKP